MFSYNLNNREVKINISMRRDRTRPERSRKLQQLVTCTQSVRFSPLFAIPLRVIPLVAEV